MSHFTILDHRCLPLLASLVLGLGSLSGNARGNTINFSDLNLSASNPGVQTQYAPDGTTVTGYYWSGPDPQGTAGVDSYGDPDIVGQFTSGRAAFANLYETYFWSGWAYSNVNDKTTAVSTNQFAAYSATGGGINGAGSTYAVAYDAAAAGMGGFAPPTITLPSPTEVLSASITNTTYAYFSMLNGDWLENAFGPNDWFKLTISAFNAAGQSTGTPVQFYLAKGTTFVADWTNVPLTALGNDVKSLQFDLTSSETGEWGMNTPAYFAMDSLTLSSVPEPSTLALLCGAGIAWVVWDYRRRFCLPSAALDTAERS